MSVSILMAAVNPAASRRTASAVLIAKKLMSTPDRRPPDSSNRTVASICGQHSVRDRISSDPVG
jgi:hypothetical protein